MRAATLKLRENQYGRPHGLSRTVAGRAAGMTNGRTFTR